MLPESNKLEDRRLSEGLAATLELLSSTRNSAAVPVLLDALDSSFAPIRYGALRAILRRRDAVAHREVLRRLDIFDEQARAIVHEHASRLVRAIRNAILDQDAEICIQGCRAALEFREYDLVPVLINVVEDENHPNGELAARTLVDLARALAEEVRTPPQLVTARDPHLIRRHFVRSLEQSLQRYDRHRQGSIIDAYILLVTPESEFLRRLLQDPLRPAHAELVHRLRKSTAEPAMELLLGFLDEPRTPSAILLVISRRNDSQFVSRLLEKCSGELNRTLRQNVKRIESLAWLAEDDQFWEQMDDVAQDAAVNLVVASGISRRKAFQFVKYMLRHGKPGGRRAAAVALEQFEGNEVGDLVAAALEDEDPYVQAAALRQLRQRGVVGALPVVIKMLDSPYAVVRQAARASLSEFTFERFLSSFDVLEEDVRRSTGRLVRKVDPSAAEKVVAELKSPVRTRRLRALAMMEAMELVDQLENDVAAMLDDRDHMVRAEAARLLAQGRSRASYEGLLRALDDRSEVVREAARESLHARQVPTGARPQARFR